MKRPYKLEILWDNGELTETDIGEDEMELIDSWGALLIAAKYSLGSSRAEPVSFQVWDSTDSPVTVSAGE